jgi:hypothetical protein
MSYTNLILQDSPISVWNLSEESGSIAYNDNFLSDSLYNGKYLPLDTQSRIERIKVPLVYSGGQCIKLVGNGISCLTIPSMDKMSSSGSNSPSTLEFWIRIEKSTESERALVVKENSNTGLYVKDQYLIFKVGDTNTVNCYAEIDTWDKPIHIAMSYSASSIKLFVDGVEYTNTEGAAKYLTKDYDQEDEFFNFYGSSSIGTYVDAIAIYNYSFDSSVAKRHFIYGVGYDLPRYTISSKGGSFYAMQMSKTPKHFSQIYDSEISYGNRLLIDNGSLLFNEEGHLSTPEYSSPSVISFSDKTTTGMFFNGYAQINEGSAIIVENPDKVFPYGIAVKYDFTSLGSNTKQLLIERASQSNKKSISIYYDGTDYKFYYKVGYEISPIISSISNIVSSSSTVFTTTENHQFQAGDKVKIISVSPEEYNSESFTISGVTSNTFTVAEAISGTYESGGEALLVERSFTALDLSSAPTGSVYVVIYQESGIFKFAIYHGGSSTPEIVSTPQTVPIENDIVSIGAENVSPGSLSTFESEDVVYTIETNKFYGKINYIGQIKYETLDNETFAIIPSTYTEMQDYSFYANFIPSSENRFKQEVKGYASFLLPFSVFGEDQVLPHRIDLGYPLVDSINKQVKVEATVKDGSTINLAKQEIFSGNPLLGSYGEDIGENVVLFELSLNSNDGEFMPPKLQYISIQTYNLLDSDFFVYPENGRQPVNLISSQDYYVPETNITPTMYYGNSTGLRIGSQYGIIDYTNQSIGLSSPSINSIMFSARIKTTSETQIISIGSPAVTIKQTNSSVVASGGTLYINGTSGSTAKNNEWNHYILVLPSPIEIGDGIEITIGKTTGTPVFYIDNLSFMEYQLTSDDALRYYRLLYSEVSEKINYSSENIEINVMDSESLLSNDLSKSYQLNKNEGLLKRVDLASTENHTFSSGTINFSTNRDLIAIDGVTLTGGELVLLGNQTNASDRKIYSVSITGSVATFTADSTTINTGDIIYVKSSKSSFVGDENEESFIQKQADGTFIQIDDPLEKVVSFDYNTGIESFLSTAE